MSKVFSVGVTIAATAYIRAATAEEAAAIAQEHFSHPIDATTSNDVAFGEVDTCGMMFDDADLPRVSLSPAMTFYGAANDKVLAADFAAGSFEEVHDDEDGDDGEPATNGEARAQAIMRDAFEVEQLDQPRD